MAETRIPSKILLVVVTRERKILEQEVDEVVLPAHDGYIGVLPGHTPLLTMLRVGTLMYRVGGKAHYVVISWGFAEILPSRVILLAEGASLASEIDVSAAERERLEAERALASLASHDEGFALAEARLEESLAKIDVGKLTS